MLRVAALTMLLLLTVAASASAGPLTPTPGSTFDTTDTSVQFTAEPDPQGRELGYSFSTVPDVSAGGFTFPSGTSERIDMGWLAAKFDHVGTFYWWVCPMADDALVTAECSQPWDFDVRFRLETLTNSAARTDARSVMANRYGSWWRAVSGRRVVCHRSSRTRQRCRVSGFAGDNVVSGRISVRTKRQRSWSLHWYAARIELLSEYCLLVRERPRDECTRVKRKRGWV